MGNDFAKESRRLVRQPAIMSAATSAVERRLVRAATGAGNEEAMAAPATCPLETDSKARKCVVVGHDVWERNLHANFQQKKAPH